jgi:hypothetical protein
MKLFLDTRRWFALLLVFGLFAAACGSDDDETTTPEEPSGAEGADEDGVLNVPDEYATIQEAVDTAVAGDLVLIAPGVYNEAVDVTTDEITIRGVDRNETILDGEFELENGIRVLGANGVAVENLTARNYAFNGFFWTGVEGYRGSYLTAYRNGDYGVYAFDSTVGLFEKSYASGSPDAGYYIGQCFPCDAVIDDVVAEYNGLGYSGTNAGGNLVIVNSTWRFNRAGIVPNSGSYELCFPERETTIVGNIVHSNQQGDTPAIDAALLAMGNGILIAGGDRNVIERNLVFDHDITGIALVPFPEDDPSFPQPETDPGPCEPTKDDAPPTEEVEGILWNASDNIVRDNVVSDSRLADLGVGFADPMGNCFAGNTFATTAPVDLEVQAACDDPVVTDFSAGALDLGALIGREKPPAGDFKTTPVPGPQENMPDALTAPARPATDVPPTIDLAAIKVPERPAGT